jgi:hypothetical protein
MTIVCCWINRSHGRMVLSAAADSRASSNKGALIHTDETPKLFAAPVRCFHAGDLSSEGAWTAPYDESSIGIGFSGGITEGFSVVAHVTKALGNLIADGGSPQPESEGIVALADAILGRYFSSHNLRADRTVRLLMFGWDRQSRRPWMGSVGWLAGVHTPARHAYVDDAAIWAIGEAGDLKEVSSTERDALKRAFASSWTSIAEQDRELACARHQIDLSNAVENKARAMITSGAAPTVGGVLQQLELCLSGDEVIAAYTKDDKPTLWDALPTVNRDFPLLPAVVAKSGTHKKS